MIGIQAIREFESLIERYHKRGTLSIFVTSKKSNAHNNNKGFSSKAIDWTTNSNYDILLTNIYNLQNDIIGYQFKNLMEDQEIKEIKEQLITLNENIKKIDGKLMVKMII